MPEPHWSDCWSCGTRLLFPVDAKGLTPIDDDVECPDCGSISQTTEDEDDDGSPVISFSPVRCGHGIEHDEHCPRCQGLVELEMGTGRSKPLGGVP